MLHVRFTYHAEPFFLAAFLLCQQAISLQSLNEKSTILRENFISGDQFPDLLFKKDFIIKSEHEDQESPTT